MIEMHSGAPSEQVQRESDVSAATPLTFTVGAPGAHGSVAGVQGAVAPAALAATAAGLDGELQMPKGGMLTIGAEAVMVATEVVAVTMAPSGITLNGIGAAPNMHSICAPMTTS